MTHNERSRWPRWPKGRGTPSRTVVTDDEARQASKGRRVLAVLLGSLALLGVYLVGMMAWTILDGSTATGPPERVAAGAPTVPSSALNTNDPPAENPAYPVPVVPTVR